MILLILVSSLVGEYLIHEGSSIQAIQKLDDVGRIENPAPVDIENLKAIEMEPFVSNLPLLMIDTREQQIIREEMRTVSVAVYDYASGENDILANPTTVLEAGLKLRGASSYNFDKNQYRLKFYRNQDMKPLYYRLFGMGADSEWVLHGPYLDHSLLRNYLMYNLSRETMDWAPDCRFFELFVDGRYQGVYLAVEPVTAGANRLNLSEFGLISGATPYIVARDRIGTQLHSMQPYATTNGLAGNEMGIRYPSKTELTQDQKRWIEKDISQFEIALYSDFFADPERGYAKYIDVDSFVDYVILNELSINQDAGNLSTYIYKELNGTLKMAVWDFNNSFNNYQWFARDVDEFYLTDNYWLGRLLQDRNFVDRVVRRYHELRESVLSDDHMNDLLFEGRDILGPAIDRNFMRWGYTFVNFMMSTDEGDSNRNPESYPEAFNRLLQTMHQRIAFLDKNIEDLYANCIN